MAKKEDEALEPKPKGSVVEDLELVTMNKINKLIAKLDPKAKVRVVSWLSAKLESPLFDVPKE